MRLESLCFENYKPFADRFDLELRPLTIFLGRNGAGKSSVIRLVPLLMHALSEPRQSGLALNVDGIRYGEQFTDLVHNKYPHGSLTIGASFSHEGQTWCFETKLQAIYNAEHNLHEQVVANFKCKFGKEPEVNLNWIPRKSKDLGESFYDIKIGDEQRQGSVKFKGILPDIPDLLPPNNSFQEQIADFGKRLVYIGPIRSLGERYFSRSEKKVDLIEANGANAPQILNAESQILEKVNKWFSQDDLGGRRVNLKVSGPVFEVFLDKSGVATHLDEVGQGMNQVFPIVVQRFLPVIKPRMEIVEEPESHLHPGAHGAVADLFWQGVKGSGLQMLVETHSEVFLLRIRRAVAEGRIKPQDVILYWIDDEDEECSEIKTLYIEENGEVDDWPAEVFSEDYREALAIRKAQHGKLGSA